MSNLKDMEAMLEFGRFLMPKMRLLFHPHYRLLVKIMMFALTYLIFTFYMKLVES